MLIRIEKGNARSPRTKVIHISHSPEKSASVGMA